METTPAVDRADPRLRDIAQALDSHGWAAELLDDRWHLVWVSRELLTMYGYSDAGRIQLGEHVLASRSRALRHGLITQDSAERWLRTNVPYMLQAAEEDRERLAAAAGGRDGLSSLLDEQTVNFLESCEPRPAPPLWTSTFDFSRDEFFGRVNYVAERVQSPVDGLLGYVFVYSLDVPASLATLLARGDRRMYERMAALVEPKQRPAAILFADLENSGTLSRQLPSSAYFQLICDARTAIDAAVAESGGIVGKHAGDGVTAFFLPEQLGSSHSRAVREALETARRVPALLNQAAADLARDGVPIDPGECRMKVAAHWGPSLYIGQVASQGRLEVTALGDEINQAARIEQSARGGQVLASKPLLERLTDGDAAALGLRLTRVAYQEVGQLPDASEKASRDAGSLPVTDVANIDDRSPRR